jgi:hypothetical protein
MRLSIGGTIRSDVELSSKYLDVRPDKNGKWSSEVVLSSTKKDLNISEVSFVPRDGQSQQGFAWQSNLPIVFTYQLEKPDSLKADGYYDYKLKLSLIYNEKTNHYGDVVIKTNHPKKPEITVSGMVNAKTE